MAERSGPATTAFGLSEGAGEGGHAAASRQGVAKDTGGGGDGDGMLGMEADCGYGRCFDVFTYSLVTVRLG